MKLYEFTFTPGTYLYKDEVEVVLADFLKTEAEIQDWADGYKLVITEANRKHDTGWTYRLEVHGEYVEDNKETLP
jgi:hypothetical protein